jgi:TetR/AcrR family transcriptional regulator, regulator of autoinduction and epiphytic fitness
VVAIEIEKIDGRRARGLRTRDAIISALLDLVAGGDVAPTAQRIADRAGVSVRSVYQHFADVEGLYADAAERTYEWVRETAKDVDVSLPITRRVEAFVDNRTSTLEALLPFHRAVRLMEPTSDRVHGYRLGMEKWEKDRVGKVFAPELRALDSSQRSVVLAGIDVLASVDSWDHMRRNGQSARAARQVLRSGILSLLGVVG